MKRRAISFNFLAPQSVSASENTEVKLRDALDFHLSIIDLIWCHAIVGIRTLQASHILIRAAYDLLTACVRACRVGITLFFAFTFHIPLLLLRFICRVVSERFECALREIIDSWDGVRIRSFPNLIESRVLQKRIPRINAYSDYVRLPSIRLPRFSLSPGWHVHVVSFIIIAFFLASPFIVLGSLESLQDVRDKTIYYGKSGFNHFSAGVAALAISDMGAAQSGFARSFQDFTQAQSSLRAAGDHVLAIARFIPIYGKKLSDAEILLEVGAQLASAGAQSADAMAIVSSPDAFAPHRIEETLASANQAISDIGITLSSVESKLALIDSESLPEEYRTDFTQARNSSANILSSINMLRNVLELSHNALGISSDRRYLVVMQNDREIRATGGFMGSFALLDVKKGAVKNIEIPGGGTYDVQGQLRPVLAAPLPLRIINPRWEFQDANWYPDFPASAQKIMWFYESAGGPSVDGVITINASVAQRVLDIIGPIEHPDSDQPITADTVIDITQMHTELAYDRKKNKPKEFLGSLIDGVRKQIESHPEQHRGELLALVIDALLSKDIQLYFRDEQSQQILHSLQLDNSLPHVKSDYLMIVDTNIGGGKTDAAINAEASYVISADENGSLTASLTITRSHHGKKGDFFTGRKNINHVRIYVPFGAELLSAAGFTPPPRTEFENPPTNAVQDADLVGRESHMRIDEHSGTVIYDSFGKTVFSNWLQTSVGQTTRATITYRLPFRLSSFKKGDRIPYDLFVDRQSGSRIESFGFEARFPGQGTIEFTAPFGKSSTDGIIRHTVAPFLASTPIGLLYSSL
ncbi:DUF4012 domain-containing protein [Candidatus Uhrbacteria bacterium]|nr:DUF4012 domain-containing protein [Candidatus Uhrbacteria bacterium]